MKSMSAILLVLQSIFITWLLPGCGGSEGYEMIVTFPEPAQEYKQATQTLRIFSLIPLDNNATCKNLINVVNTPEDASYFKETNEEIHYPYTKNVSPLKVSKKDTRTRLFLIEGEDSGGNIIVRGCVEVIPKNNVHTVTVSLGEACPPGGECISACGNGIVEPGETCDIAIPAAQTGACSTGCDDANSCTIDTLQNAGTCQAACTYSSITTCTNSDGCCSANCNSTNDNDCSSTCGDSVISGSETCDPPSTCPTSCDDGNACTIDVMTGSSTNCNVACSHQTITQCKGGDGCCPNGCNVLNDGDCPVRCGDSVISEGETCDPPDTCPSCDDGKACTTDTMTGSKDTCNVACSHQDIVACENNDGCCPPGCNANYDNDCKALCGNGVVETGETCDPPSTCPTSCDDGNVCTTDSMTGSPTNCNVTCSNQTITQCKHGDGCCPSVANCNNNTDSDCAPICGNGVVEAGENCDPPNGATCDETCHQCVVLSGTWITRVTTTGTIIEPSPIDTQTGTIDLVQRLVTTKSSGNLKTQLDICSLKIHNTSIPLDIDYSLSVLATFTAPATEADQCGQVGSGVTFPSFVTNSGWGGPPPPASNACPAPPNRSTTPYPYSPGTLPTSCSGAIDSDNDGVYGIAVFVNIVNGFITYYTFIGTTITTELSGMTIQNPTTINGNINFSMVGYTFGSQAGAIGNFSLTPDSPAVPITFIKLAGNVPCSEVLTHCTGATCVP